MSKFSNDITESVSAKLLSQLIPRIKSLEDIVFEQVKNSNKSHIETFSKSEFVDIFRSEINNLNLLKNVENIIDKKISENSTEIQSQIINNVTSSLRSYIGNELHSIDIKNEDYETAVIKYF